MRRATVLASAGLMVLVLTVPAAGTAGRGLPASWSESAVVVDLIPGSWGSVRLELTSEQPVLSPALEETGALAGLVLFAPLPSPLPAGSHEIQVSLWVPANTRPGRSLAGVILLRDGTRVVGQPLRIAIQVVAPPPAAVVDGFSQPSPDLILEPDVGPAYIAGELAVFASPEYGPDNIADLAAGLGGQVIGRGLLSGLYQLRFEGLPRAERLDELAADLNAHPAVELATLRYLDEVAYSPDDPRHGELGAWGVKQLGLESVWDPAGAYHQTGAPDVGLAIVDNHFDLGHEDLDANDWAVAVGEDSHGTSVASVAAATGNNGIGMTGVMWQSDLGLYEAQVSPTSDKLDAQVSCEWMMLAAYGGAEVINYSAGELSTANASSWQTCINRAVKAAAFNGHPDLPLFVFAAGNDSADASFHYPSALAEDDGVLDIGVRPSDVVMSVGAHDSNYELSDWGLDEDGGPSGSNWGPGVTVLAPGTWVNCAIPEGSVLWFKYSFCDGTSMAAPFVAGLAGLAESHARRECGVDPAASDVKWMIVDAAWAFRAPVYEGGSPMWFAHAPETLDNVESYCGSVVVALPASGPRVSVLGSQPTLTVQQGDEFHVRHSLIFASHCLGDMPPGLSDPRYDMELRLDGTELTPSEFAGCWRDAYPGGSGYPVPGTAKVFTWQFPHGEADWPLEGEHILELTVIWPGGTASWTRTLTFTP